MREEPYLYALKYTNTRITPACAGRTVASFSFPPKSKDHPRVCGKNSTHLTPSLIRQGSPPRVREELINEIYPAGHIRITPACAGRTVKESPFYAFSFSNLFINPFTFVASSLRISTFVLICSFFFSPIP